MDLPDHVEVFIVRQDGREEWVCGVYSTREKAEANSHRHEQHTDEIVSYLLDEEPVLIGADGLRLHASSR